MKRTISLIVALLMLLTLTACAGNTAPAESGASSDGTAAPETKETSSVTDEITVGSDSESEEDATRSDEETEKGDVLVVFFSATGTTKGVAEKIAAVENADLYEIVPAEKYTSDDLNWHDNNSRTTKEQNDSFARPAIGSERISLDGYTKVYVGFPIWWGEEPRIMDTFVESYDFDGITVIPFCTSSSSGMGRSGQNLAENAKSGTWKDGMRFGQSSAAESDIASWIESIK